MQPQDNWDDEDEILDEQPTPAASKVHDIETYLPAPAQIGLRLDVFVTAVLSDDFAGGSAAAD